MIPNLLTVPLGLFLAYAAIFSPPPGGASDVLLGSSGVAIVILALWARFSGAMKWQTDTNIACGAILTLFAVARTALHFTTEPFWIALLSGTTAAILALWSVLYRPTSEARVAA